MNKILALVLAATLAAPAATASADPAIPMPAGGVSAKGPEKTETIGRWAVKHQPDGMTDELTYTAALMAKEGDAGVAFTCTPSRGQLGAAYRGDALLAFSKESRNLIYRFDDEPAVTSTWAYENYVALVINDAAQPFIGALERHARLRIRAFDVGGTPEDRNFDLTGAKPVIARMRVLCAGGR